MAQSSSMKENVRLGRAYRCYLQVEIQTRQEKNMKEKRNKLSLGSPVLHFLNIAFFIFLKMYPMLCPTFGI
jgi:hypothetical protein